MFRDFAYFFSWDHVNENVTLQIEFHFMACILKQVLFERKFNKFW